MSQTRQLEQAEETITFAIKNCTNVRAGSIGNAEIHLIAQNINLRIKCLQRAFIESKNAMDASSTTTRCLLLWQQFRNMITQVKTAVV